MIKPKTLVKHELIGLLCEVVECKNKSAVGLKGKVVDETKNILTIETEKGEKKLIKKDCKFMFTLPTKKKVLVDGELLVGRPEIRTKKKLKKKRV